MHQLRVLFLSLICIGVSKADDLSKAIEKITDAPEYKASRWGLLVVDAKTGATVYEREPDRLFVPASTTKLYTCATALAELGPNYRFNTPVFQHGTINNGVLKGELILQASGDLTMGGRRSKDGKTLFVDSDHTYASSGLTKSTLTESNATYALDQLAKQIKDKGIKEVIGGVYIDVSLFPQARSSGSGPDVISPITINDNVIDIVTYPGKGAGVPAEVLTRPATDWIKVESTVKTVAANGPTKIVIESNGKNRLLVSGTVPAMSEPTVRIHPINQPDLFARALFIEALNRQGIKVTINKNITDDLDSVVNNSKLPLLASYESEPLSDVIKVVLKVSHNLYASTLPILVGLKHNRGTIERGLEQQAKFLQSLNIDPATVSFAGGAGGMIADMVTPRTTVKLLQAMAKHPAADVYFDALPIIGVDGTLAGVLPKDSPAYGKCRAKTGTLVYMDVQNDRSLMRSKALAGELTTAKGAKLYFAMFLNDVPLAPGGTTSQQGKVLGKVAEAIHIHGP